MSGTELATVLAEARDYVRQAKAINTVRVYRADWADFAKWCAAQGREALPTSVEAVVLYLTELARTHRVSTLTRRLAALSQAHQLAGFESPTASPAVRTLMAGIRRSKSTAVRQKKPVLVADLERMIVGAPAGLLGQRDTALLLVGFAGAFRRSELVALDWEDVGFAKEGLVIQIRRSKTDPEGQGRKVAIPYGCPRRALPRARPRDLARSGRRRSRPGVSGRRSPRQCRTRQAFGPGRGSCRETRRLTRCARRILRDTA